VTVSKRRSTPNRRARLTAGVGSLAPLARTPERDAACLALPPTELVPLASVSEREGARYAA